MSDSQRSWITVAGGGVALLIAVFSSLAIGPGPIFTFDKVVVGALLVGGLGAFGVAINIGQSPQAKALRDSANAKMAATPPPSANSPSWTYYDMLEKRVLDLERLISTTPPVAPTETEPVAKNAPLF